MFYNHRPHYFNDDDLFGYSHPNDAAIERYLLMQDQQRREAALARRRRRELQDRKQRFEQKQRRRRQQFYHDDAIDGHNNNDDDDRDYETRIVRGRDGSLYYVQTPIHQPQRRHQRPTIAEDTESSDSSSDSESSDSSDSASVQSDFEQDDFADAVRRQLRPEPRCPAYGFEERPERNTNTTSHNRRRRVITVEDASDSECESEFDSPWRNRRPSPGQWMEPVESFLE